MKIYISLGLIFLFLLVVNIGSFQKRKYLKKMKNDYSFLIDTKVNFSFLDSLEKIMSPTNYILCIVSPTCEDCYVKINKWDHIASEEKKLQKKILFIVTGDECERLDEIIKQKTNVKFVFDYKDQFQKLNPYVLSSLTYLLDSTNKIILCGEPLRKKVIMNIFKGYIN